MQQDVIRLLNSRTVYLTKEGRQLLNNLTSGKQRIVKGAKNVSSYRSLFRRIQGVR